MSSDTKQPVFLRSVKDGKVLDTKQFSSQQIVIGREGEIDFAVNDPSVSPIHAMVEEREPGKYFVSDLGSQAGTYINGEKIVDSILQNGTEIHVGQVTVEFHIGVPKPRKAAEHDEVNSTTKDGDSLKADAPASKVSKSKSSAPKLPSFTSGGVEMVTTGTHKSSKRRKAAKGTFAPSTSVNFQKTLRPGKGNTVEITLAWQDRVLNTYHFNKTQTVQIGSHPKNQIILPVFGSVRVSHPILNLDSAATIYLTSDMTGEINKEGGSTTKFDELKKKGLIFASGSGFAYTLQQNELVKNLEKQEKSGDGRQKDGLGPG